MNFSLKYRPNKLEDLVGQDVVVRIIRNMFLMGDFSSPLLMVGASGVGKTTSARIVALCLNCRQGPTAEPCGECSDCVSIRDMSNPDVIEMDAASNTGVEDIRVILENSNYLPFSSRYKVYIIDEVHMLSISAFNALLKTLENPAAHVKFIMATTDIRKVPVTVLSRCQRMDLLRISVKSLYDRLVQIAEMEGVKHDDRSLVLIAEHSAGSMRNAIFLLEQSSIYTKGNISEDDVKTLLGCVDNSLLEDIVRYILLNEVQNAVSKFRDACVRDTPVSVCEGMLSLVHELCIRAAGVAGKTCFGEDLLSVEKVNSASFLSRLWQLLSQGMQEIKSSGVLQYQTGEMLIIRLCYISDLPSPKKLASFLLSREDDGDFGKKKS
ncbi:DNA polymerase III subunit gamma/tau [Anaplasma bovis]|uniref:DNA polymerase III subunit gamma/tau n=1 Tax=Anaplasma bovis TaxID=186733 RepID=UPI002FF366F4